MMTLRVDLDLFCDKVKFGYSDVCMETAEIVCYIYNMWSEMQLISTVMNA